MDAVALAATIGGSLVGLAGIGATAWSERSKQALEIRLARGERLFEHRREAYEAMLAYVQLNWERIQAPDLIRQLAGRSPSTWLPERPEPPPRDEWRRMYVRLRTVGSAAIADQYRQVTDDINAYYKSAGSLQELAQTGEVTPDEKAAREVVEAQERVRSSYDTLERLVSEELETL